MNLKDIPLEILILILEMLEFDYSLVLCDALNISKELAFQYLKSYDKEDVHLYINQIYDYQKCKLVNPNIAKAMLKNAKFQSLADANDKVMFAILSQDLELVKNALKDPNVTYEAKDTNPFRNACEYGQFAVVQLLVNDYGIDISAHDNIALVKACEEGRIDIVKYILSHPDFKSAGCSKAFISASENARIFRFLHADSRFDPSFDKNRTIIEAALNGNAEIVKLLLEDPRVNPADQYNRALSYAAQKGNVEIVQLLLADTRVDPSDKAYPVFIDLSMKKYEQRIQNFISDPKLQPLLLKKATENVQEIVKLLLDYRVKRVLKERKAANV